MTEAASDEKKRAPLLSFANSQIITVMVGPEKRAYTIHKDVLLSNCLFFEKCLKNDFKEDQHSEVSLLEDEPAAFDLFVIWVYQKVVRIESTSEVEAAIRAFLLADKFCMPAFQNALVDQLREHFESNVIRPGDVAYVFENGPPHSKLKSYMFEQLVFDMMESTQKYYGEYNMATKDLNELIVKGGELAVDLMWAICSFHKQSYDDPCKRKGCQFHDHATDHTICQKAGPAGTEPSSA